MITLGITGRRRYAASALAVDGRLVAAVSEASITRVTDAGYRDAGFPVASVSACLRTAGMAPGDVGRVVSVRRAVSAEAGVGEPEGSPAAWADALEAAGMAPLLALSVSRVNPSTAHAWQAAGASSGPSLILSADLGGRAALYTTRDGAPSFIRDLPGLVCVATLVVAVAHRLGRAGTDGGSAIDFLEQLATGATQESQPRFTDAVSAPDLDAAGIAAAAHRELDEVEAEIGSSLRDPASVKVTVQRTRASVAASFLERLAAVLAELVARWRTRARLEAMIVAGDLFSSPAFIRRVRARTGEPLRPSPVPEAEGAVLGAALIGDRPVFGAIGSVALGPVFTEAEAKAALENARLDYLYEPRWDRLLTRVSRLLARGKVVAWFQGPAEFGPRSLGGRSVLADPSDRYVRDNINRFFKQRDERSTLAVSMQPHLAAECFDEASPSPWMLGRATVRPAHRDRFRAALDGGVAVTYHTVADGSHPALGDLLRVHHELTGAPALVNTTLAGPGEPTACSPRDGVRTFFSSALDALVMHRFLLMKDYWQMRSEAE